MFVSYDNSCECGLALMINELKTSVYKLNSIIFFANYTGLHVQWILF